MKRVFLRGCAAILIIAASTTAINAQPPKEGKRVQTECQNRDREERKELTPEERATKITERMKETLELNETQAKKLYKVNLDYINRMIELKSLKSQHNLEILELLDDNQSVEFMEMITKQRGEKRAKRGAMNKEGQMEGRGERAPERHMGPREPRGPKCPKEMECPKGQEPTATPED